jgi:DNA (cytosine-5)-methyltransferase 1
MPGRHGKTKMRFATVCSGIGAPEVAWAPINWQPVFCSEIEPFPCAVLNINRPEVPNYGDMKKFKEWPDATVELICAGTPCQAFSVAGLRKGLDDPRGNLTLVFLGILQRYRPRWVVWENVPGVLSDKTGAFGAFLGGLGQLGYGFAYRVLDAQYFGVPQRRRRVFVVGHLGNWQYPAAVLFERHSLQGHTPPSRKTGQKPTGTISARTKGGGGLGTDFECAGGLIAHSLRAEGFDASEDGTGRGTPLVMAHGQGNAEIVRDGSPSLTCNHEAPIAFAENQRGEVRAMLESPALSSGGGKPGSGYPAICFKGGQGAKSRGLGIGVEVAPTLPSSDSGSNRAPVGSLQSVNCPRERKQNGIGISDSEVMYSCTSRDLHGIQRGMQVRRLTPRECERLQGFPDDYTLVSFRKKLAADGPRYKALGNSMAVPVVRWIGDRIQATGTICAGRAAA